jgi:hypothetical protein
MVQTALRQRRTFQVTEEDFIDWIEGMDGTHD